MRGKEAHCDFLIVPSFPLIPSSKLVSLQPHILRGLLVSPGILMIIPVSGMQLRPGPFEFRYADDSHGLEHMAILKA